MTVCLDQMGPEAAKSFPGQRLVRAVPRRAGERPGRATQELDDGPARQRLQLRGVRAGDPAKRSRTRTPGGRSPTGSTAWSGWRAAAADAERVYAIVDNRNVHRATDVLLFALAHPRWEFVFQPKYAAYLNLIEPWWKVLRSLALKGRRFET